MAAAPAPPDHDSCVERSWQVGENQPCGFSEVTYCVEDAQTDLDGRYQLCSRGHNAVWLLQQ
jgi:hypothetical protein